MNAFPAGAHAEVHACLRPGCYEIFVMSGCYEIFSGSSVAF